MNLAHAQTAVPPGYDPSASAASGMTVGLMIAYAVAGVILAVVVVRYLRQKK